MGEAGVAEGEDHGFICGESCAGVGVGGTSSIGDGKAKGITNSQFCQEHPRQNFILFLMLVLLLCRKIMTSKVISA